MQAATKELLQVIDEIFERRGLSKEERQIVCVAMAMCWEEISKHFARLSEGAGYT